MRQEPDGYSIILSAKTLILKTNKDLLAIKKILSYPSIIKTSRLGYDGKGQFTINNYSNLLKCWNELDKTNCVIEEKINIKKEIVGEKGKLLTENLKVIISFYNEVPINIELPNQVTCKIASTETGVSDTPDF